MDDLDREFTVLQEIIEENKGLKEKNAWGIFYHYWRFYQLLNQRIANAKDLEEEIQIIEKYVSFYKGKETAESGVSKNQKDIEYPPHLQEIARLMKKESDLFSKNLRRIKAAKDGKAPASKPPKFPKKRWLKS